MHIVTQLKKLFIKKPKVIVVLGATSTGKSDLAIDIARLCDGEVISADSRQVYRGMDLGSGKVTAEEMRSIPHHLLSIADPTERFSAHDFKTLGENALVDILSQGKTPIVCGGTGFYIDSLVSGTQLAQVPENSVLRSKLESKDLNQLQQLLKKKASRKEYNSIDIQNKVRIVRALEILDSIGHIPKPKTNKKYNVLYIGLDIPKETLNDMILARIHKRMEAGMIAEVKTLLENGVTHERLHELGLEYRHVSLHIKDDTPYTEMVENLLADTKRFVKRQRTWFKRNKNIHWFNPLASADIDTIKNLVKKFLE